MGGLRSTPLRNKNKVTFQSILHSGALVGPQEIRAEMTSWTLPSRPGGVTGLWNDGRGWEELDLPPYPPMEGNTHPLLLEVLFMFLAEGAAD